MPAVLYPFPYVAVHVIKAERVGIKAIYGYGGLSMLPLGATVISVVAVVIGL